MSDGGEGIAFLNRFRSVIRGARWIFVYIIAFGAAPVVLQLSFGIGPPWPSAAGVAMFTSMVSWAMLIYAYVIWGSLSMSGFRGVMRWAGPTFGCGLVFYIGTSATFVMNAPDFRHQVASGFVLRPGVVAVLKENPEETAESLLKGAGYDATMVWEGWSVGIVRFVLLASWLATVTPFFLVISLLVLMEMVRVERSRAG